MMLIVKVYKVIHSIKYYKVIKCVYIRGWVQKFPV